MNSNSVTDTKMGRCDLICRDVVRFVPKRSGVVSELGGGVGATAAHLKQLGLTHRAGAAELVEKLADAPSSDCDYNGDLMDQAPLERILNIRKRG